MPIATPDSLKSAYGGDSEHFAHVLNILIRPALEIAGLKTILPIREGAEVIQAVVFRQLQEAHLVLCDMSALNANVFFELGLRTAMNKPVAIIKDNVTTIPFDVNTLNCFTYDSTLSGLVLEEQRNRIASHIAASIQTSNGENNLWKVFGRRIDAMESHPSDLQVLANKISELVEAWDECNSGIKKTAPAVADLALSKEPQRSTRLLQSLVFAKADSLTVGTILDNQSFFHMLNSYLKSTDFCLAGIEKRMSKQFNVVIEGPTENINVHYEEIQRIAFKHDLHIDVRFRPRSSGE